jgi:LacI family transcriptional regulator
MFATCWRPRGRVIAVPQKSDSPELNDVAVRRPVGIRAVAETAGVSVGTVSHVLNRPDLVSEKNLHHVQKVMDELGFVRNNLARQVKLGGGNTLSMITLSVENPFFAALVHACEAAAEAHGLIVVVGSSDQSSEREDRYIDLFEGQQVAGMLIAPVQGITERMRLSRHRSMPMVMLDSGSDLDFCSVSVDGEAAGYIVGAHLLNQGRRHLALLGGPLNQVGQRWSGVRRALLESPDAFAEEVATEDQSMQEGVRAAQQILRRRPEHRPDAIFAANDQLALGALQVLLADSTIRVPDDICLVGHDDIAFAASAAVPLTTVRQPVDSIAREAVRLMLEESRDLSHEHEHVLLQPELIVRASA